MQRLLPRAIVGAIVALILFLVVGGIVLLAQTGMPRPGAEGAVMDKAAAVAPTIDLVGGILVLVLAGWWAARPFAGRQALLCAGLLGIVFIALDLAIGLGFGGTAGNLATDLLLPNLAKLAAALAGGWLGGGRRSGTTLSA